MEQFLTDQVIQGDTLARNAVNSNIDNLCHRLLDEKLQRFNKEKVPCLERIEELKKFRKDVADNASQAVQTRITQNIGNIYVLFVNEQYDFLVNKDKSKSFKEISRILKQLLVDYPELNQYPAARYKVYSCMIQTCFPPAWTRITRFDYTTADTELKPVVDLVLNDPEMNAGQKLFAAEKYVNYLCGKERFAEAEALAKSMLELPKLSDADKAQAYIILSEAYRFQDKYDLAMNAIKQAIQYHPLAGKKAGSTLALKFNKP